MIDIWSNVHVVFVDANHGSLPHTRVVLVVPTFNEMQRESLRQLKDQHVTISITPDRQDAWKDVFSEHTK